jgi:hypothetical protein
MMHGTKTISEISVGTIVEGQSGYSKVTECVHGNKFYSYLGRDMMDAGIDDDTNVVCVSDDDTHQIDCCN